MGKFPHFRFNPQRFLGDDKVMLMCAESVGAHILLMSIAWQQNPPCSLPNDIVLMQKWSRLSVKKWKKLESEILKAWRLKDKRWYQDGLLKEYIRLEKISKLRKKAAEKRWDDDIMQVECKSNANGMQEDTTKEGSGHIGSSKVFISVILNNKKEYKILESDIIEFEKFYPAVDVRQELRNLAAWNKSNPTRRKTKQGILRHINTWLSKAQNRAGKIPQQSQFIECSRCGHEFDKELKHCPVCEEAKKRWTKEGPDGEKTLGETIKQIMKERKSEPPQTTEKDLRGDSPD